MSSNPVIVFVCEHGAAKSVIAAVHFNRLASQMGLDLRAVARGTNPDPELSPQAVEGLSRDGLTPLEAAPQELTQADLQSAQHVVTFCELPTEFPPPAWFERWEDIPSVNENYEIARNAIVDRIYQMLNS